MAAPWNEIILIGALVGLFAGIGPLILDYILMIRLVLYINMDRIQFEQLLATGNDDNLAFPLSQKLAEKGILLAWKSQREIQAMRVVCEEQGFPMEPELFDTLKGSLETYRDIAGMLSKRIGVLGWHVTAEYSGSVPPFVVKKFKAIDRDWVEFDKYSAFLRSFLHRHTSIKTDKL